MIRETGLLSGGHPIDPNPSCRLVPPQILAFHSPSSVWLFNKFSTPTTDTYSGAGGRTYDAENRMTSAQGINQSNWQYYSYNADGQRVRRKIDGVETWQVYGMDGELLAEYAASAATTSPQKEYGYRNGQLLLTAAPSSISTQNVSWTNAVGVSLSGNSLTKTAADGWGNGGAASSQTILSGDGYVEFSASTTGDSIIGLSQSDPDQSYNIDFSIHVDLGAASVWEAGVHKTNIGSYSASDRFRVSLEGGAVKYRKNGTLLYTSTVTPTYSLLADTTLYKNGSTLTNVVLSGNLSGGGGGVELNWLVSDQLGTPRMIFDKTGSLTNVKRHDYLPFGEELFASVGGRTAGLGYSTDTIRQKFTSKERDNETGLDYFINRYYSSIPGRFTSADPIPMTSQRPSDPQRLNLYAYVRNNPLVNIDPNGLDLYATGSESQRYVDDLEKATKLKLKLDSKTGKISIVSEAKKLTDDAKRIKQIIGDDKNTVRVEAIRDTEGKRNVLIGAYKGDGTQVIDYDDVDKLGKNKSSLTAGSTVIHETTEAYEGLVNPTVLRAKELGYSNQFQFGFAHPEALKYENIYRSGNRLPKNLGGSDAPIGGRQIFNSFATHTEILTYDQGGRIVDFKVVKNQ